MKHFFSFLGIVFAILLFVTLQKNRNESNSSKPTLRVLAYSSFTNSWGPGTTLKDRFESNCLCRLELIDGGESTILLQKANILSQQGKVDLIIGFDQFDIEIAKNSLQLRNLKLDTKNWDDNFKSVYTKLNSQFAPFDWGVFSLVTSKKSKINPQQVFSVKDLSVWDRAALEDPRTSTPGLHLLLWLVSTLGEESAFQFLDEVKSHIHSYSASWSSAYGFFSQGQASSAFSYITSPIFHIVEEDDDSKFAIHFQEGHPIHIEFLAAPQSSANPALADKFIDYLLGPEGQKIIMEKNYMFPVLKDVAKGTKFEDVSIPKVLNFSSNFNAETRTKLVKKWSEHKK